MTFLRSLLFNIYFVGLTFVLGMAGLAVRAFAPDHSLALARCWGRWMLAGLRTICCIRVELSGAEFLPHAGPALIASQHQSALDTVVWLTLLPRPAYVLKKELTRIPLFGPLLRPAGQVVLDRQGGARALRHLLIDGARALAEGRQVIIFPEGTRAPAGTILPPHPGVAALAARTATPIIPVGTDSGLVWGRRAFLKRPGTAHLVIHKPLDPTIGREALLSAMTQAWIGGDTRG